MVARETPVERATAKERFSDGDDLKAWHWLDNQVLLNLQWLKWMAFCRWLQSYISHRWFVLCPPVSVDWTESTTCICSPSSERLSACAITRLRHALRAWEWQLWILSFLLWLHLLTYYMIFHDMIRITTIMIAHHYPVLSGRVRGQWKPKSPKRWNRALPILFDLLLWYFRSIALKAQEKLCNGSVLMTQKETILSRYR